MKKLKMQVLPSFACFFTKMLQLIGFCGIIFKTNATELIKVAVKRKQHLK